MINREEIFQEDVVSFSCDIVDLLSTKINLTPDEIQYLENDGYVEILRAIEKIFNYPDYRTHM